MPVRLRQELQGLPWGAGIVALSCGIRECFATCCPCSSVSASLLCNSTNFFTATIFRRPPKSKKVGQLPSLRQFQFFDPTAFVRRSGRFDSILVSLVTNMRDRASPSFTLGRDICVLAVANDLAIPWNSWTIFEDLLSCDERATLERIRVANARKQFLLSRALARISLGSAAGIPP